MQLPGPGAALAGFAAVVGATHHLGLLSGPLGRIGPVGVVDLVDLLVPYLVVGSAALVLAAAQAGGRTWALGALGAVVYVQGHALHLAGNSVANVVASGPAADAAHVWDETAGHGVWYAGLALLVVALARALPEVRVTATGWLLAAGVGVTHATNALGSPTAALSLLTAGALAGWGLRRGGSTGRLLSATYGLATAVLLGHLAVTGDLAA